MPSAKPSRAVTAVERRVLLKCGHQAGLVDGATVGMAQDWGRSSTVAPYRLLTFATQVHRFGPAVCSSVATRKKLLASCTIRARKLQSASTFSKSRSWGLLTPS